MDILKQLEQKIDFINERVIKLEKENKLIEYKLKELKCYSNIATRGCHHLKGCESGIYNIINPQISNNSFQVSCDLETLGGGWTIIQRRQDGSENFYRNWSEYTIGFGNITNEFFMGLNKLHALTSLADPQELYIILEDFKGDKKYARYGIFKIDSESTDYTLTVDDYSGNAGDSLQFHNGSKFSTNDRDNDIYSGNCAESFKGSWWYKNCYYSNLNGKYYKNTTSRFDGVNWRTFRNFDSLKFVQMMIRPKEN
ncbi:fibrinogen C domain-containing protein 1-like [Lucilia sericata]|uniref:fibrinogen C domain-containing protein 1-like n=1 Tax=Lucilia sericata TaxID=13632 RepID=UPI0018A87618|nr:fibrinogen C domain-containing protein 1-like [Lucilia sericata]